MNDSELITAVQESVTGVHTATPVRARRRIPALAAATAVLVAAVLAGTALLPGLSPGRPAFRYSAGGLDGSQAGRRQCSRYPPRPA